MSFFEFTFLQNALAAAILASITCGVIGPFIVASRMASLTGGIAHASLGGVGLALACHWNPLLGALGAGLIAAAVVSYAHTRRVADPETLISAVWAGGMSLGLMFLSTSSGGYRGDLSSYLFGSLLFVSHTEIGILAVLTAIVIAVVLLYYRVLVATVFDADFAATRGVPTAVFESIIIVLGTVTVVALLRVVGIVLAMALIAIPPVAAKGLVPRLSKVIIRSIVINLGCSVGGLFIAFHLSQSIAIDLPVGPLIVLLSIGVYLISAVTHHRRSNPN